LVGSVRWSTHSPTPANPRAAPFHNVPTVSTGPASVDRAFTAGRGGASYG
jgi:hypothetical protein